FFLTGRDRNRRAITQPDVAVDIIRPQRFFEPADVEFGESLGATQCGPRVPHATGVDQECGVWTDSFASAVDQLKIERLALAHWLPTELHGLVACFDPALADGLCFLPIAPKKNGGVSFDALMLFAAQQTMNRLAEVFSFEVPQRHIDGTHRADRDRGAPEVHR